MIKTRQTSEKFGKIRGTCRYSQVSHVPLIAPCSGRSTAMPDVIRIPLGNGKVTIVDELDYPLVAPYKWYACRSFNTWYARTSFSRFNQGTRKAIDMHALIVPCPPGMVRDHRNGDGLDNRRENIRICTQSQNQQNRAHVINNTSGFKGVTWHRQMGKWQAAIKHKNKSYHLGLFDLATDAARAYDRKARELFGEFARTNFAIDEQ